MWSTDYSTETEVAPSDVWAALRNLHSGVSASAAGDVFELHGPFAVGTELSVTPKGQDTFSSTIIELAEDRLYADRTEFGDVTLVFRHTLTPLEVGGTRITHSLEIAGDGADRVGPELGPQISADFPSALDDLIEAAGRISTQAGRHAR
jgi:hypothetical protein